MNRISDVITIVIPGYNEEKRICQTLRVLIQFCIENFESSEIIFVNDGSSDHTFDLVKEISSPLLRCINLPQNRGKGYAVRKGMLQAKGDYCFFTDADLPYDLSAFGHAMKLFQTNGCEIVVGDRNLPNSDRSILSFPRIIASRIFHALTKALVGFEIHDSQCGFKGFSKKAAQSLFSMSTLNGYAFDVEILALAKRKNLRICNVPVTLQEIDHSKINLFRDPLFMLYDIMKLYIGRRRLM